MTSFGSFPSDLHELFPLFQRFSTLRFFFTICFYTQNNHGICVCVCSLFFFSISQLKFVFIAQKSNSIDSLPKNQNIFNELNHKMWNTRKQTTNKTKKQISCEWSALELYQPIGGLFFKKNNKKTNCVCVLEMNDFHAINHS